MTVSDALVKYREYIDFDSVNIDTIDVAQQVLSDFRAVFANKKIILYGAGCLSNIFAVLFQELRFPIAHITAKNWREADAINGIAIESPQVLQTIKDTKEYLLIASCARHTKAEMEKDLKALDTSFDHLENGYDIGLLLQSAWCFIKAEQGQKIDVRLCHDCFCTDGICKSLRYYLKKEKGYQEDTSLSQSELTMFECMLSNICTLQCKYCAEAVPYMEPEQRHFVSPNQVIRDVKKVSQACGFVTLLDVVGGEPFLHPEFAHIIAEIVKIHNIGLVQIFSNGTVVPDETVCRVLNHPHIMVFLSNYQTTYPKRYRGKVFEVMNQLEQYHVQYRLSKNQNWLDTSGYAPVHCDMSEPDLEHIFRTCQFRTCVRVMDGRLYVCPHQCAGIKLGKLENANTLDIHSYTDRELAHALTELKALPYIEACKYCPMPDTQTVLAGEQL